MSRHTSVTDTSVIHPPKRLPADGLTRRPWLLAESRALAAPAASASSA